VARLRQDARADTQKTVQSILERARREADSAFQAAMTELQGEVTQARAELAQRAAMLAERAASRILNV
jgi:F0F1-type ATP synthase membrane subunit b/b'